jgi:hypothetical protein
VTATMATATQASTRANKLGSPLHDHDDKQDEEKKGPHEPGLALKHT